MTIKERYWTYSHITLIIILGAILFREFWIFSGGFLGAFTVYVLVRKQMHKLTEEKKMNKNLAAALILIEVIVLFLIPVNAVIALIVKVLDYTIVHSNDIISSINNIITMLQEKLEIDLFSKDSLLLLTSSATKIGRILIGEASSFAISAFVLILVLYFMLISSRNLEKYLFEILPFKESNKQLLISRIKKMIISNAVGIPLLAVIQGITATIGYYCFNAPLPLLLGLFTCFATIIPIGGTALIWLPAAIYMAVTGDWENAIALGLYGGIIISNVDNLFRFMIQKRMANIHPLITIFGVIIGLSLYGFWGIIFGPVLISVFLILVDMFKKEYLDTPKISEKIENDER